MKTSLVTGLKPESAQRGAVEPGLREALGPWREGDVFRWSYVDEGPEDRSPYRRYHCCSMIGIVRANGRLYDTYWGSGSENRSFGPDQIASLRLQFLGNLADFDARSKGNAEYYADADLMDLSHSNSSMDNFYIRKGAARCPEKMLSSAQDRLEQAERDERWASEKAERLRATITQIKAGEVANVYL